jgi:predicted DNA-binding WGR domain protein
MSATRIDEAVLVNTQGNHRKAYRVWLEAEGALFHVGFAYGRIGSTLREGRKTTAPVVRATADAMRAEIVLEKEGRGYVNNRTSAPAPAAGSVVPPPTATPKPRRPRAAAVTQKAVAAIPVNRVGRTTITF